MNQGIKNKNSLFILLINESLAWGSIPKYNILFIFNGVAERWVNPNPFIVFNNKYMITQVIMLT